TRRAKTISSAKVNRARLIMGILGGENSRPSSERPQLVIRSRQERRVYQGGRGRARLRPPGRSYGLNRRPACFEIRRWSDRGSDKLAVRLAAEGPASATVNLLADCVFHN